MTAARLTGALLVRKGQARPCGGLGTPTIGLAASLPTAGALARPAALRRPVEIVVPGATPAPAAGADGPGMDLVNLTVRIDRATHTRLRLLAARQHRTNQDIVGSALDAYLRVFDTGCACVEEARPKK